MTWKHLTKRNRYWIHGLLSVIDVPEGKDKNMLKDILKRLRKKEIKEDDLQQM